MATVHVVYNGRNETLELETVFPQERLGAIGIPEGTEVTVGNLSENNVKTALAQHFDVGVDVFEDHYVEINPKTSNITVRPNTTFGE